MAENGKSGLSQRERALLGMVAGFYGKLAKSTATNLDKLNLASNQAEAAQSDAEAIISVLGTNSLKMSARVRNTAVNAIALSISIADQKKKGIELMLFDTSGIEEGEQELEALQRKISSQPDLFA